MKKILFQEKGHMYKANLHCHTTVSDGAWTPEETKERYKAMGYQVVAFSDHEVLKNHSYLNDDDFLSINACEMGLRQSDVDELGKKRPSVKKKVYHFNLLSMNPDAVLTPPEMTMEYEDKEAINAYIKARNEEGFLVNYNHPAWSLQTYEDYTGLKGLLAMEIYNHGCEVVDGFYGYSPQVYDEMLRTGGKLYCVSTDDNHSDKDVYGGYVMINSESLEYTKIMNALKEGDFYASQGPSIHEIILEDNKLKIRCSEVDLIVVYTDGRRCYVKQGNDLTEAEFELKGEEAYVRVMCRDKKHRDANSNAYWL